MKEQENAKTNLGCIKLFSYASKLFLGQIFFIDSDPYIGPTTLGIRTSSEQPKVSVIALLLSCRTFRNSPSLRVNNCWAEHASECCLEIFVGLVPHVSLCI